MVAHAHQNNLHVPPYNIDADIGDVYAHSPWTLLEGGYRVTGGQKLKLCLLVGYEITFNALGKIAAKLKNPNSAMPLLIYGKSTCSRLFLGCLLTIKQKAGRGNINGPLPTSSNVVHACFSEHVMSGFYTHDISERSEAISCFENCTGEPSTSPPLGPGDSRAMPLFIPDVEDDEFDVCSYYGFEICPHHFLPATYQSINVHKPNCTVIIISDGSLYTFSL